MLTVVKVGGRLLARVGSLDALARALALPGRRHVVVHGGGAEVSEWQRRLGVPVERIDGLRVTTPEVMALTAMVLSGWANKRLVAALRNRGEPAVGLSGEDGVITAVPAADRRLGAVGEGASVDPGPLRALLAAGYTPVLSPVSRGPSGEPLNVNADTAAQAVATALGAAGIVYLTDVPGVLVGGRVVERVDAAEVERLTAEGIVRDGMAVKLGHALAAARAGLVATVGGAEVLSGRAAGTRVVTGEPVPAVDGDPAPTPSPVPARAADRGGRPSPVGGLP